MPDAGTLLLFAVASLALIVVPGPSVGFILTTTLRHGRRAGLAATAGVETGYGVHVLAAVAGVSAVVAVSATAFSVVKVAGAAWLLWLAVRAWRARTADTVADTDGDADTDGTAARGTRDGAEPAGAGRAGPFRAGLLVGALNPKTAVFYLAFLPQFVRPDAGPAPVQLLVLGLLFVVLAWVVDSLWAVSGDLLRRALPRVRMRVLDRLSATVYAALAAVTLTARRAA